MKDTDDWVVRLSASAWQLLKELEALCEHSGLDCYIQAQIKLCAASDPKDIALWSEVWTYVQTREGAGWNDRLFVVIEPDEACAEASLLCSEITLKLYDP